MEIIILFFIIGPFPFICPNHFGRVQIVLDGSKIILDLLKYKASKTAKFRFSSVVNQWNPFFFLFKYSLDKRLMKHCESFDLKNCIPYRNVLKFFRLC